MTTVQLWLNGEHYVLDREQWEELTEAVDGPVHQLPDGELQDLAEDITDSESTD
jgi:hypothetical protein